MPLHLNSMDTIINSSVYNKMDWIDADLLVRFYKRCLDAGITDIVCYATSLHIRQIAGQMGLSGYSAAKLFVAAREAYLHNDLHPWKAVQIDGWTIICSGRSQS